MRHLETGNITPQQLLQVVHGTISANMKVVPTGPTIEEIRKQADDCELHANKVPEPQATRLREKAELLREWVKSLGTGAWKS